MSSIDGKTRSLAARISFAHLYDQKEDIYSVILEYVLSIIDDLGVVFSVEDAARKIEEKYSINVPDAVIKTALKRLLKPDNKTGIVLKKEKITA